MYISGFFNDMDYLQFNSKRMLAHEARDLILEAREDRFRFTALALTVQEALGAGSSEQEARRLSLDITRYLLERDLVYVGDLNDKTGLVDPWRVDTAEALERIAREWPPERPLIKLGEIACFKTTPKGAAWVRRYYRLLEELGYELLDEEGEIPGCPPPASP